jgi:hypothetical protein
VRAFSDLVDEAAAVDVSGWGFEWLDGRATEERPPWGYSRLLASRLAVAASALDIDTGGGEIIAEVPQLPPTMVVTEGWPPNVERARRLLSRHGVDVVPVEQGRPLPFPEASFELVSSRHPVTPDWHEIARVLVDDGTYLAQHVGPASAFELIEWFLGPLSRERLGRDPAREAAAARSAGLRIVDLRTARCRMRSSTSVRSSTSSVSVSGGYPTSPSIVTGNGSNDSTSTSGSAAPSWPTPPGPSSKRGARPAERHPKPPVVRRLFGL